ncbi:DegV family protein [Streptococcus sp. S784/96/1]|uniref:DegV family protein n=1 Tax=Streptococcus sp. S784/96/1 TaxID=2653499 RepID=UPI001389D351|nr:DegV family protein [Streptococcus sp. S784/96/1]
MMWKIVADSGCNFRELENLANGTEFVSVPLTIQIGSEVYVDDSGLDIDQMMANMYASSAPASSACPSPDAYARAFEGAQNILVFTITGGLSGSYNSARVAKEMLLEEYPNVNIHIVDTLSAGGEIDLLVLHAKSLIEKGLGFEDVVLGMKAYRAKTKLIFALAKVDNLVKNGRLSKLLGKVVGLLNIRMVGEASDEGKLELLQKPRGQKRAVVALVEEMLKAGYQGGKAIIAHHNNDKICQQIREAIHAKFPGADIQDVPTSGLCSFYAEEGGLLMGYEIA